MNGKNHHFTSNYRKVFVEVTSTSLTRVKFDAKIITLPKQTFMDCSALECVDFTGADSITELSGKGYSSAGWGFVGPRKAGSS